jgi:hypothetical protein
MKVVLHTLLLLLIASFAFGQSADPVITGISPTFGPTSGGTEVTITGDHLAPTIVCILPCPTKVRFDNTEVVPKSESPTKLVVVAPAHAQGVVDVTVIVPGGGSAVKREGFAYGDSPATAYETLLLPIYLDGRVSGANGSQWQTDFWIRNGGSSTATLAPWECPINQSCPAVFPLTRALAPGESIHNLPAFFRAPTANPARLLYVSRGEADNVAAQLRFADVSRATLNAGTEMPVVREGDLLTGSASLLNVPFDSRFRVMLRIDDVALTESRFRVAVYTQETGTGNTPLHTLDLIATTSETGDFRLTPAYAQFSLDELAQLPKPLPSTLRLEITPLTAGSRFWSFVSVTNNETQLVTLVTPQ